MLAFGVVMCMIGGRANQSLPPPLIWHLTIVPTLA